MLTVEHAAATIRFSAVNFDATSRRLSHSVSFFIPRYCFFFLAAAAQCYQLTKGLNWFESFVCRDKFGRLADNYAGGGRRACKDKNGGIKATAKDHFSSGSEPVKQSTSYHPSEDIGELELMENEDARLKPAECSRTIIEVNCFLQNILIRATHCVWWFYEHIISSNLTNLRRILRLISEEGKIFWVH